MRHFKMINYLLFLSAILLITGCDNSSKSSNSSPRRQLPVINSSSVSKGGCFNIEMLQSMFQSDSGSYPAIELTTDFQPDSSLGRTKSLYHTHAAFDVRDISTTDIFILNQPSQLDCNTVQAHTASGEILNFKISRHTPTSITLVLDKPNDPNLSVYRKEGLTKKIQPLKYEIEIMESMHLRVKTTYRGFDAHCRTKKTPTSTIQKEYHWAPFVEALPQQVAVSEKFYNEYVSTLRSDFLNPVDPSPAPQPTPDPNSPLPVPQPLPEPQPTDPVPAPQPFPQPGPQPIPQPVPQNPDNGVVQPPPGFVVPAQLVAPAPGYIVIGLSELKSLMAKDIREDISRCTY